MTDTPTLPSDHQLVDAARAGHDAAWHELMERHEDAIRAIVPRRRRGKRSVDDGLDQLHGELGVVAPEGQEAIRAFRPRAVAAVTGGAYGPGPDVTELARVDDDDQLLASAFARLPEPWQTVLWHVHVEQLSAAEVSPLVGRAVKEVTELLATAERGLIDSYLVEYLDADDFDPDSGAVVPLLSGHVRDALPPHEQRVVDAHLASPAPDPDAPPPGGTLRVHTVDDSRRLIAAASSIPQVLPPAIAPGITGTSVEALRSALGTATRSVGEASLAADRSDRVRIAVVIGSVAAVVLALIGVAYLVRQPFDNDAELPTTTVLDDGTSPTTSTTSGDVVADTSPSTTELDLRPIPSGPSNQIELVVDGVAGGVADGVGFAPVASPISSAVSSPAPIFAGGTGTLDIVLTNPGDATFDGAIRLVLPRGVVFDALVEGAAVCANPADDSPSCTVSVAPAASITFTVRVALESVVVGTLDVVGDSLAEPFVAQISATRDLVHNSVGHGGVAMLGNTVMACDPDAASATGLSCDDVMAGRGDIVNRWDVPMHFVGADDGLVNSSRATLDLAPGATIVSANLFWSGDLEERGTVAGADTQSPVTLGLPNGERVEVTADHVRFGQQDSTQYVGRTDVTALMAGGGEYLVGNVATAEVQGSYGAWALVVVIDDPAQPRRHRIVTDPFDWVAPDPLFEYGVQMPVPVVAGGTARLDVLAFEGERDFRPETLSVGGTLLGGDSAFDGTIAGTRSPSYDNNLGVDIDAYDLTIDTPDGILDVNATSAKDGIRLAVLGLSVDLPA